MPGTLVYNADMFREAGLEDKIAGEYEIATWSPDELKEIPVSYTHLATVASLPS